MRITLTLSAAVCAAFLAGAQGADMNSKVYDYLENHADAVRPQLPWTATTPEEHAAWRETFHAELDELLGHHPDAVPLEVTWDETVETDTYTRRKVYIRSEADYWVPAYYFVPNDLQGKAPAIICFHGHSGILPYILEGTEEQIAKGKEHQLGYAIHFAEHGYVSLAVVQRGWNETANETPHSCHRMAMDGFLTGTTPVGMRVWDGSRCIDFLEAQPEVDASRIGAAGLSGGGTTTLFFAAMDSRVKLAMVAGYYCTFRDSIYTIHHCICNCVPGIMQWGEMSDVGALIAPRPVLIISGDQDKIFPIDATKRAYEQLQKTYAVLGANDNIDSDFFEGEHEWSNAKTVPFLKKHFGASEVMQ